VRRLCLLLLACSAPMGVPDAGAPDAGPPDAGGGDAGLPPDTRATSTGLVRGADAGAVFVFKGIPYATAQRFAPPQPAAAWSGVRDALAYGPSCVQVDTTMHVVGSEDCLSLNVWTPMGAASLPVLVFIHGGNNQIGCSCDGYYEAQSLVEAGPAVVVTLNYRLAAFGFLADPLFADDAGSTGNWGLRDQLAALRWVQDNIAAFGGDPTRVMVFGHSAGSLNTAALVSSPLAAGLFSRAGLHSGAGLTVDSATVQRTWMAAEQALSCTTADCLRSAPVDAVARLPGAVLGAANPQGAEFNPTVDGVVLPATPLRMVQLHKHNAVPMLVGTTQDEYSQLIDLIVTTPIATDADYQAQVNMTFAAPLAAAVLAQYPSSAYPTPRDAFVAILNDVYEICPTRQLARAYAAAPGQPPVHRFIYTHDFPGTLAQYGAAHGFDIYELFGDVALVGGGADEQALSQWMQHTWTQFAATGDPGWTPYDPVADSYERVDWPLDAGVGARKAQCDFWDSEGL
jgi:para-nitrobenzyl esterase